MCEFQENTKRQIQEVIDNFMNSIISRRVLTEPFHVDEEKEKKPFHYALVPAEIWKGAKFERSFVTVLGQIGFERIAKIIAEDKGYSATNGYLKRGEITESQNAHIHQILYELERSSSTGRRPDLIKELRELDDLRNDSNMITTEVTVDLFIRKPNPDREFFIEIKASKPNSDQTKVSKEKLYKIYCMNPNNKIYFALPDNPYLTKENYSWEHPKRWFDMNNDPVVVMGSTFWNDVVGNSRNTWSSLIKVIEDIGEKHRTRIRTEYLGQ